MIGSFCSCASNYSYVLNSVFFYRSIASPIVLAIPGANFDMKAKILDIMFLEKAMIRNMTWMLTLLTALPSRVGKKKVRKGIWKCPHINPARSNSGFGT